MSHYVKKYYNHDNPIRQMLIFLHGYNGEVADIDNSLKFLSEKLSNTVIVAPQADEISEKNPLKKQWYSLRAVDKEDKRRDNGTPLAELIKIYNQYDVFLREKARQINLWINQWQEEYGLDNEKIVIAGFSQGGMLACYTALTRENFNGKCLMFSAVVAGGESLEKEQNSCPDTFLFHGENDVSVNYKTMAFSEDWLKRHRINTKSFVYRNLAHTIVEDELSDAVAIINNF